MRPDVLVKGNLHFWTSRDQRRPSPHVRPFPLSGKRGAAIQRMKQIPMFRAYWKSADTFDTVSMTFQADPPVRVELDAEEVDDVLTNLGELRAMMQPEHPDDLSGGTRRSTVLNPHWVCEQTPWPADSVLHIRDPRYGWLGYVFTADVADQLAAALTDQLAGSEQTH